MNYLALLVSSYLALAHFNGTIPEIDPLEWNAFKQEHGKTYENELVEAMRMVIYAANKQKVEHFNQHHEHRRYFKLGLNELSDLTEDEAKVRNGLRLPPNYVKSQMSPRSGRFVAKNLGRSFGNPPDSVDWRTVPNRVSAVKNQGHCGSCWAFASTGVLEGQEMIHGTNKSVLVELSEQNLLDCTTDSHGCKGGSMMSAFSAVKKEGGIQSESTYPYTMKNESCLFKKEKAVLTDTGYEHLSVGDEGVLKETVAEYGPVSVGIDASSKKFRSYKSGVYIDEDCGNGFWDLDHAVLVVGYGTDKEAGDYWIVKNSWGEKWGEKGYIKMARNRDNMCGIASFAVIATL